MMWRWVPANSAMKPGMLSQDCMEMAAIRMLAIQPSVSASSAWTLSMVSPRSMMSLKKAVASSVVKRRSAARSSHSCPRTLRRASGRGGSTLVATTTCACGGRWSTKKARDSWTDRDVISW